MKTIRYHFPLALGLAAALAACSANDHQAAQSAVAPAPPASPAPATLHPPAAPPAARPPQWVRRAQPAVVATAAAVASPSAAPPAAAATPGRPAAPAATAAPLAREVPASSLPEFLAGIAPAGQVFEVRAGHDTLLVGQQGTRIGVPADAFDLPTGSGPVHLRLREFYSTPDIVLAGLGTRAGQQVLETGGMLHLYAEAGGQTVHLRPGRQLLLQLPTRQQLPGMSLYEGVSAEAGHAPDWRLAGVEADSVQGAKHLRQRKSPRWPTARLSAKEEAIYFAHPPKSPRWPAFAKGNETLLREYARLVPDTKADQAWLRRKRPIGHDEQQLLKELSRENHTPIRHALLFEVATDSTGALQTVRQVAGDSVLGAKALAAVRQLPPQRPASFISRLPRRGRTASAAQGMFSVLYARSGKQLIGFQWLLMDKQFREELALEAQRQRALFARQYASASTPLALTGGLYYELAAGGLGWINCDRLLAPGPRIQFAVATPDAATVVSLVFKGQRSILASSRTEGRAAIFEQVPDGAAATVVALRRENGITYLATTGVRLGQPAAPVLDFRPVSLAELRGELTGL